MGGSEGVIGPKSNVQSPTSKTKDQRPKSILRETLTLCGPYQSVHRPFRSFINRDGEFCPVFSYEDNPMSDPREQQFQAPPPPPLHEAGPAAPRPIKFLTVP